MTKTAVEQSASTGTLVKFLNGTAERFGSRTALLMKPGFRYQKLSYDQLLDGADQVASLLQRRGLEKGDRALIWGHNSPQWVLAFFGCLRAGVIVVPLDLRSPRDFVDRVVSKTQPKLAFVSRVTPEWHGEADILEIRFEDIDDLCRDLPVPEDVEIRPDDLVEIMFTSGTTGDPKGVMLSHRNLMSNLEAASRHVPGKSTDRLVSILPLSHMFEQMGGLLMALRVGANVTYPTSRQPTVLFRTMSERKVTLLLLVPQALDLFMKGIEREVWRQGRERMWNVSMRLASSMPFPVRRLIFRKVHRRMGGALELVVSGGAALDPELAAKWESLGIRIIQGYGATEASPVICIQKVTQPRQDSVGPPVPGMEVKISHDGEVLIKGPSVTSGYWEAPDQTAATFEDGWYKTGDQGSLEPDGSLRLKGRKKDMIVLASGQNVFPEDIEAVLKKHPDVADAAVVGLPQGADTEVHAALLMNEPSAAPGAVSWANQHLAEHQRVRGHTVWPEDDFPRTHTLKVKKTVIVDILQSGRLQSDGAGAVQKPPDSSGPDLEGLIVEIGELSRSEVTPEKTLGEDLGLDSLKRVELLSAIEGELGVYLEETEVSGDTSVSALKEMIAEGSKSQVNVKFASWGMSWWCRPIRGALQRLFVFPLLRLSYKLQVSGKENLDGHAGPLLFAANHHLPLDNALIIKSFPSEWRRRLAIAGAANLWSNPVWAVLNTLLGNGFPFSKEGAIRPSLDNVGRIVDDGWSVLIYPEGGLTVGGPLQPFLSGMGLLAVEGDLPVVPIRLDIHGLGSPSSFPFVRRGRIGITFGRPLTFAPRTPYPEATAAIEEAVRTL